MPNLYEVLNLQADATPNQIKSQYRRLAKRYHPDLNPDNPQAGDQFREVQRAYEVLADPTKRQAYDDSLQRTTQHKTQSRTAHAAPREYYRNTRPRRRRHPLYKPHKPRAAYLEYTLELTLEQLFKGARCQLTVAQTFSCSRCKGKGIIYPKDSDEPSRTCERCDGYGFLVSYEKAEVLIPPGILPDMTMRVAVGNSFESNEGEAIELPLNNYITIQIRVKEHPLFSYKDQHLYATVKVPENFLESGGEWSLPAPEGGQILLNIPAHTRSGTTLTVRRHGLRSGSSLRRGNLYCTIMAEA